VRRAYSVEMPGAKGHEWGSAPLVPGLVLDYPENVVGIEDHVILAI
jgi:hypothetical protein